MARTVTAAEPRWLALAEELGRDPGYDSQMQLMESGIFEKLSKENSPIVPSWWKLAVIIASVVGLIFVLVAGWLYYENQSGRHAVDDSATLAVAVLVDGCDWELGSSQKPILNSAVHAGSLKLNRGEISLAFLSGVTLNMKGPAEIEIRSIDHVFCKRGQLRVSVPPGAEGFTVLLPGAAVVDIGSEFVVDVRLTGQTRLTVLEGKARASVFAKDGAVREQIVEESKSVEIDPANNRITEIAAPAVPGLPPLAIPPLNLSPNYAAIIRSAKPWGYWRCEEIIDGVISNEVADGVPLMLNGALSIVNEGGKNHSIAFSPNDTTQFLGIRPTWTPPASGCAIDFLFVLAGYSASSLASIIAATNDGHFMLSNCSRAASARATSRAVCAWFAGRRQVTAAESIRISKTLCSETYGTFARNTSPRGCNFSLTASRPAKRSSIPSPATTSAAPSSGVSRTSRRRTRVPSSDASTKSRSTTGR